jgi:hypothetical protein
MDWISVEQQLPPREEDGIIVAIMQGRKEFGTDPIQDALIVILRRHCNQWMNMDVTRTYHTPDEEDHWGHGWTHEIRFWKPWKEFGFPKEMVVSE